MFQSLDLSPHVKVQVDLLLTSRSRYVSTKPLQATPLRYITSKTSTICSITVIALSVQELQTYNSAVQKPNSRLWVIYSTLLKNKPETQTWRNSNDSPIDSTTAEGFKGSAQRVKTTLFAVGPSKHPYLNTFFFHWTSMSHPW